MKQAWGPQYVMHVLLEDMQIEQGTWCATLVPPARVLQPSPRAVCLALEVGMPQEEASAFRVT